jgi:ornithine carbamoyltransferase
MSSVTANKLLTLADLPKEDIAFLIQRAHELKTDHKCLQVPQYARQSVLVLYFEKRSTRTRLSCTKAWTKLGGTVIDMSPQDGKSHINVNESIYDSFRVIADMSACIVARVHSHETLNEIYRAASDSKSKPSVINGLSDKYHPLQILADLQTMYEHLERTKKSCNVPQVLQDITVTWVGDSNNVFNSLATTLPRLNVKLRVCVPPEYPFKWHLLDTLERLEMRGEIPTDSIVLCDSPEEAVYGADFVVTDTWVSMGDETQREERLQNFTGFQINRELIVTGKPKDDWRFLHCLPRKQEEVTDDIFYSDRSLVFEEAENRMWTVLAVFVCMLTTVTNW